MPDLIAMPRTWDIDGCSVSRRGEEVSLRFKGEAADVEMALTREGARMLAGALLRAAGEDEADSGAWDERTEELLAAAEGILYLCDLAQQGASGGVTLRALDRLRNAVARLRDERADDPEAERGEGGPEITP